MSEPPSEKSGKAGPARATLRTISELTGLSPSTVSLALRGGERLKPETYRRVTEAAAQLGYVPDRAGVRLRTGKTNVIALVLERTDETIDFARYLIQGIGHAIQGTRYHLNVTPEFGPEATLEAIRTIVANRTADGVIITHTMARDARVQLLMDAGFPFVTHGRTEFHAPHPYNDYHSEEFIRLAVARLAQMGRRRLLLVVAREQTYNHHTIVTTYREAAARHGLQAQVLSPAIAEPASAETRAFGREIARMAPRPDGIICDSELRSLFIIAGLQDESVALGRDVHFICKQTSELLPTLYPELDTIEEDVLAAGMELARLLIRRIEGEPAETLRTLGEPRVHWRG
ncbi:MULTISPECIES: LacI family transcriptional regulator [unclassified Devosia]|uniref:LacI family transcriptional regulator n=1 Tax=unclassified Devosia TaxID=196773 RepID=UPI000B33FD75|nr:MULTISPECIES: LacI family transcriptional regulator [unclassified Devosia]MBN9304615.1 substrate-binding domain-containing protein [Devosia sp.]